MYNMATIIKIKSDQAINNGCAVLGVHRGRIVSLCEDDPRLLLTDIQNYNDGRMDDYNYYWGTIGSQDFNDDFNNDFA